MHIARGFEFCFDIAGFMNFVPYVSACLPSRDVYVWFGAGQKHAHSWGSFVLGIGARVFLNAPCRQRCIPNEMLEQFLPEIYLAMVLVGSKADVYGQHIGRSPHPKLDPRSIVLAYISKLGRTIGSGRLF